MKANTKQKLLLIIILSILMSISVVSAADNSTYAQNDNQKEPISTYITDNTVKESSNHEIIKETSNNKINNLKESNHEIIKETSNNKINNLKESNHEIIKETPSNDITKNDSKIESPKIKGYETFTTTVSFKLSSNDKPLASKQITININGLTYTRTTDNNGEGQLNINLKKGTYIAEFNYLGDELTKNSTSTSTITILTPIKTSLELGDKDINYRQGSNSLFYVKLLDLNGKPIKNQNVSFKFDGKTYIATTDSKGNANIYLNLKKGKHKIKYSFTKTEPYLSSKGSYTINVKAKIAKGNGYWLWSSHMKTVNLKKLAKKGTKHIILHIQSISQHGKSKVISFIKKAHKYGIKVHLWMQICYKSKKWVKPVNSDGNIRYSFLNKKIKEAKRYTKIKGVDGIHFDYVRFGGSAHKYKTSIKAINYFVKKASIQVRKIKSNIIVSAAIMPEPKMMHYYYGQDVPTMSKYMDTLIPMVYKGNYHKTRSWIKSVTKTFVKQSNGAQIWTGLQAYHSDNNGKKLSHKTLLKDAKAAKKGGAKGIILFRIGISHNLNFKKV